MKALLFCPKDKPYLYDQFGIRSSGTPKYSIQKVKQSGLDSLLRNNKVLGEFDYEIEEVYQEFEDKIHRSGLFWYRTKNLSEKDLVKNSCLKLDELSEHLKPKESKYIYGKGWIIKPSGYVIKIKNLQIYDKPKDLEDYVKYNKNDEIVKVTKARNMMRVYECIGEAMYSECHFMGYDETWYDYVLISRRPEEMARILNGRQSIIISKEVLKEMKEVINK